MNLSNHNENKPITTALLLAAGTGSRLFPLTQNSPKCLTLVNEKSILERLVIILKKKGFKRLVIVTGYQEIFIKEFLGTISGNMTIEYVYSPLYRTTNNIYSLWMARNIINEPFVLVESDLVFDASQLDNMLFPDRIAVAPMAPWMNGTSVLINQFNIVKNFVNSNSIYLGEIRYKTVNIYSFSLSTWHAIIKRLNEYIATNNVNIYYEAVLSEMVADGNLSLQTVLFNNKLWYEIDTIEDLVEAEKLFPAEIYETDILDKIILQSNYIPDHFVEKITALESQNVAS